MPIQERQVTCQRCGAYAARYRISSDLVNLLICTAGAVEARQIPPGGVGHMTMSDLRIEAPKRAISFADE